MGILTTYSKNTVTVLHTDTAVMYHVKSESVFMLFIPKDCSSVEGQDLILNVEEKAVAGRIFCLHWLSSDILLSCSSHGVLGMWKLGE